MQNLGERGGQLWPWKEGREGRFERLVRRWGDRSRFLAGAAEEGARWGAERGDHGKFWRTEWMCCGVETALLSR